MDEDSRAMQELADQDAGGGRRVDTKVELIQTWCRGSHPAMELVADPDSGIGCWDDYRPVRGHLVPLGSRSGVDAFLLNKDSEADTWIMSAGDVDPVEGCYIAGVCSSAVDYSTLLVMGPMAMFKCAGRYELYVLGEKRDMPVSVLLALGLADPEDWSDAMPLPDPPRPSLTFRAGIADAGLLDGVDDPVLDDLGDGFEDSVLAPQID